MEKSGAMMLNSAAPGRREIDQECSKKQQMAFHYCKERRNDF